MSPMNKPNEVSAAAARLLPLAIALALGAARASAQEDSGAELPEGHSGHGEAFNEGPRQAAWLMERPSSVHFPVSSAQPEVQSFFDQGVGQLHGFWYFEAERSFRQVARLDPDCAMAYWGMAMANVDNGERAAGFARVGWLKRGLVSERERLYIDAMARFHGVEGPLEPEPDEPLDEAESKAKQRVRDEDPQQRERERAERKQRAERLVRDYEEIIWRYPDDLEAKALLVNRLWLNRQAGIQISSRSANEALLQQIFAVEPEHPAHHYRIHLWDQEENAQFVVDSAVHSGPSWPSVAHMWHMGGHIFARLGRHSDASWQQEASARVDHAHMMRDRVLPDQIHNFAHNNEWLTRSLRHQGRVSEAVDLAMNMIELPRHPVYNRLDKRGCSASYGRQRLVETLSLFEQWDELVRLSETMYLEPASEAFDRAELAYHLGIAHVMREDDEGFRAARADLEAQLQQLKLERVEALDEAESAAVGEGSSFEQAGAQLRAVLDDFAEQLDDVSAKLAELDALHKAALEIDVAEHLKLLDEHDFEPTLLTRLYLGAGMHEEAETLAREVAERHKGQIYDHANLASVLLAVGKQEEALEHFDELRAWSARAELELPVFERLRPLAELRGLPADWRVPFELPADVGQRPDLAALGPLRWTPPPALDWSLSDGFGHEHALADYRGRPVLVVFFLGFGCVHCVEQLGVLAPMAQDFHEAGIDIVAIGTDTKKQLARSQAGDTEETAYPFPILSDSEFEVFRRYRAYDDFEDMALHGTFLVDGNGKVRWQDISYEPFMQTEFLLRESIRLLGLPGAGAATLPVSAPARPASPAAAGRDGR